MKKRIVAVDDNAASLMIIKAVLSEKYDIIPVTGGPQLLKMLKKITPDLLIMDIQMPQMTGFEAYAQVQKMGLNIPVVFLSGSDDPASRDGARLAGGRDYILKPFEPEDFCERISRYV